MPTILETGKKWVSSKKDIEKNVITDGTFGEKPVENSVCVIIINEIKFDGINYDSDYVRNDKIGTELTATIGELDTALDRKLEECLKTMFEDEVSNVKIQMPDSVVTFKIKLVKLTFNGFLHDWPANVKYPLAQKHRERGVELFKQNRHIDAFYRFSKACRLLLTCVLEVDDDESTEIDDVKLTDIDALKTILYGNLASCQLKAKNYEDVIVLCSKVLAKEPENVKAIYKRGMAYTATRDFEKAEADLVKFLTFEPNNQLVQDRLVYVRDELVKSHERYVNMCERMFRA